MAQEAPYRLWGLCLLCPKTSVNAPQRGVGRRGLLGKDKSSRNREELEGSGEVSLRRNVKMPEKYTK